MLVVFLQITDINTTETITTCSLAVECFLKRIRFTTQMNLKSSKAALDFFRIASVCRSAPRFWALQTEPNKLLLTQVQEHKRCRRWCCTCSHCCRQPRQQNFASSKLLSQSRDNSPATFLLPAFFFLAALPLG